MVRHIFGQMERPALRCYVCNALSLSLSPRTADFLWIIELFQLLSLRSQNRVNKYRRAINFVNGYILMKCKIASLNHPVL